jgi:hypothetical protein
MKHPMVLAALFLAAMVFYITGSATGAMTMAGGGVLLELAFWYGLIQRRRQRLRSKKQLA